jgi:hypothetical protein
MREFASLHRRRVLNYSVLPYRCSQQSHELSSDISGIDPSPRSGEHLTKARGWVRCTDTIQAHDLSRLTLVFKELACFRVVF